MENKSDALVTPITLIQNRRYQAVWQVIKVVQAKQGTTNMDLKETNEDDDLTWSIPYAGSKANLGKNASYAAARRGEIPTIRFGKKLRVPKAKFLMMLSGDLPEDANRRGKERNAGEPEGNTVTQGAPKGIIPANRRG